MMTLLMTFGITPTHRGNAVAPHELALSDLTMVVPVKNNQTGIKRLLETCLRVFASNQFPAEILLVDNLSHPPVEVPTHLASSLPVRILICTKPGAAAARNLGARQAQTPWLLFLDSDCLLTPGLIDGYRKAMNGAVAYAGMVKAERSDLVSRYYEAQSILIPPPLWDNGEERPAYLITCAGYFGTSVLKIDDFALDLLTFLGALVFSNEGMLEHCVCLHPSCNVYAVHPLLQ